MTPRDIADIVVAFVAIGGFVFSVYSLYLRRKEKRPYLTAKLSSGFLTLGQDLSEPMMMLEVANPGEKSVVVAAVEIDLVGRKAVFPNMEGSAKIPFELQPGRSATFWTPIRAFVVSLRREGFRGTIKIRAIFRDAVGNSYYSSRIPLNTNERRDDA